MTNTAKCESDETSAVIFEIIRENLDPKAPKHINNKYPPYDIRDYQVYPDKYEIIFALAGFKADALDIIQKGRELTVSGRANWYIENYVVLHRGIGHREFSRVFHLDDYIDVDNVSFKDGMLVISLRRSYPKTDPVQFSIDVS